MPDSGQIDRSGDHYGASSLSLTMQLATLHFAGILQRRLKKGPSE